MELRVQVAVPAPLFFPLAYLAEALPIAPGCRVQVPLGRRQVVGIALTAPAPTSDISLKCRPVTACLDTEPFLPTSILQLCTWAAAYYHHPIGEVFAAAIPANLRAARPIRSRATAAPAVSAPAGQARAPNLTPEQVAVIDHLSRLPTGFNVSLIEGVTGSGKTEVYLRRVAAVLDAGDQALILTPEIGLTPQLVERFRARFGAATVGVLHSGLTARARRETWLATAAGDCRVLIGTRSAVFVPMPKLALIVIDEEHDASFKQQDGFHYSARDLAIRRAQQAGAAVILGSATPSLESLHNVQRGRYHGFHLRHRVQTRRLPQVKLVDCRGLKLQHGLAPALIEASQRHLDAFGQVLMFVNRRGYAPALLCHDCGWVAPCPHCDARLALHRARGQLICHHCGSQTHIPVRCGQCSGTTLIPVGQGTERLESALRERFPDVRLERFDSDRAGKAGEWERLLEDIRSGSIRVLVGTQMLAKGHDFPGLSLVGVVDADHALFSTDFRAIERMGQLLTQVSGRAGRGDLDGEVLVQTHQPDHPHLQRWLRDGYAGLAQSLLDERRRTSLPPYVHLALIRADSLDRDAPLAFLRTVAAQIDTGGIEVLGPSPAPMERRANRHRAQLLLRSRSRTRLQALLTRLVPEIDRLPGARKLRWSVDVDPADLY
ncbi:MAG: replication restart helicase PriA [Panacagrimonas sp.]